MTAAPASIVETYVAKVERDAETIKKMRGLLTEAWGMLNAQVVLKEDYDAWSERYTDFLRAINQIEGGVAFVMGPDAAPQAGKGLPEAGCSERADDASSQSPAVAAPLPETSAEVHDTLIDADRYRFLRECEPEQRAWIAESGDTPDLFDHFVDKARCGL